MLLKQPEIFHGRMEQAMRKQEDYNQENGRQIFTLMVMLLIPQNKTIHAQNKEWGKKSNDCFIERERMACRDLIKSLWCMFLIYKDLMPEDIAILLCCRNLTCFLYFTWTLQADWYYCIMFIIRVNTIQ